MDKIDFEKELAPIIKRWLDDLEAAVLGRLDDLEAAVLGRVVRPLADADGVDKDRVVIPKWKGLPTEVKAWGSVEQYRASVMTVAQPLRIAFPMPGNVDILGGRTDVPGDMGGPDKRRGEAIKVSRPANHGKPWTEEGDLALMASLRPMVNWETICLKAGRSSDAVRARLLRLELVRPASQDIWGAPRTFAWNTSPRNLRRLFPEMTSSAKGILKIKRVLRDSGWPRHDSWATVTLPVDLPPIPKA